jgi:hypothetical protein
MEIFRLQGDGEYLVAGFLEHQDKVEDFFVEYKNSDPMCRLKRSQEWYEIVLQPYPGFNHKQGQDFYFGDVIRARNIVQGAGIMISDFAKTRLEPYIQHECAFLPVNLLQAPQKYWFIYITNILDALNIEKSQFKSNRFSPKTVKYYSFDSNQLENVYLFRLPGHFDYLGDRDFATLRFLELTQKLELKGFEFWDCNNPHKDPIVTGID